MCTVSYRNAASGDDWAGHKSATLFRSATFNRLKSSPDVILGGTDCRGSKEKQIVRLNCL